MNDLKERAILALTAISEPDSQITLSIEEAEYLEIYLWDNSEIMDERRVIDGEK